MPIYAYRCEHCAFQKDVLQKMSDPLLVTCPSCGEATFRKQVTAAGFQLKGSGWYVTDFRNPAASKDAKEGKEGKEGKDGKTDGAPQDSASKGDGAASEKSGTEAPAPSAAPAASDAKPAPTTPAAPTPSPAAGST